MKTETHVGNAVLFLNGILMISVLTEPFGGWWWFWCGWGILFAIARVIRNFIPGFWVYHVCNYGEHESIRTQGFNAPRNEERILKEIDPNVDVELLGQQGKDAVSFTLYRARPVLKTRRFCGDGTPLVGFWVYVRTPVRVIRNQMVAMHGVFGNKDFGQIAEVVVPRDQIDYSTWSYSDPRTVWDRCVTALVWLSSWYEDVDQIKKAVVVWRAAGVVWKNVFIAIYTKCCKKFQARKCN